MIYSPKVATGLSPGLSPPVLWGTTFGPWHEAPRQRFLILRFNQPVWVVLPTRWLVLLEINRSSGI